MKEEIQTFDARNIPIDIRKGVEDLLVKNAASFDSKVTTAENSTNIDTTATAASASAIFVVASMTLLQLNKLNRGRERRRRKSHDVFYKKKPLCKHIELTEKSSQSNRCISYPQVLFM